MAFEPHGLPTGGCGKAVSILCSDSGTDRATCDPARGVSIRSRRLVLAEYEWVLATAVTTFHFSVGNSRPGHLCGRAVGHRDRPRDRILEGESARQLEGREPLC